MILNFFFFLNYILKILKVNYFHFTNSLAPIGLFRRNTNKTSYNSDRKKQIKNSIVLYIMPFTGEKDQGWVRAFSYVHVKKMHFYNNNIGYFKSNGIVTNFSIIFLHVVDVVNSY